MHSFYRKIVTWIGTEKKKFAVKNKETPKYFIRNFSLLIKKLHEMEKSEF